MAPGNKKRLYIVIFAHTPPDRFHWGICTGPKNEEKEDDPKGFLFHITNPIRPGSQVEWKYECRPITSGKTTRSSLARITIGKILDFDALKRILEHVPVRQGDPNWRCRQWVRDAVAALANSTGVIGTSVDLKDWAFIEGEVTQYGKGKTLAGRYSKEGFDQSVLPTYDLIARKEVVP